MNKCFKEEFIKLAKEKPVFFNEEAKKSLLTGGVAGTVSTLALSPLDAIKDTMRGGGRGGHKSFATTAKNLYHEGGIGRFYRGAPAAVLKGGLAMGMTFGLATYLKQLMEQNKK